VPAVVILIMQTLRPSMREFDFAGLGASVRVLDRDEV
jgi:hypothetical protein